MFIKFYHNFNSFFYYNFNFQGVPKFFVNFPNKLFNIKQNNKYNLIFDSELKKNKFVIKIKF